MATITLVTQEDRLNGWLCSVAAITDNATDDVLDLEVTNTFPIAFTASVLDQRDGSEILSRTIPANTATTNLPTALRNRLQNRNLVCAQTHGQAQLFSETKRGQIGLAIVLIPNE